MLFFVTDVRDSGININSKRWCFWKETDSETDKENKPPKTGKNPEGGQRFKAWNLLEHKETEPKCRHKIKVNKCKIWCENYIPVLPSLFTKYPTPNT